MLVFETSTPELLISKKIIFSFFRIPNSGFPLENSKFSKKNIFLIFGFQIPNSLLKSIFKKKYFLFFFWIPYSGFLLKIE